MSCVACDRQDVQTFVRVGKANVMIVGCEEHLAELIRIFRLGLEADRESK